MGPVGSGTTGGDAPRMLRGCSDDNKMRINSTLRKTRNALMKIHWKIYMCIGFRVYFLIRLTIYRSVRIYLYLCRYASMYIYLCIYGLIYLCEGLATKWASNPTFEKPDPFINRHLDIYVCVSVRVYLLIRIAIYLAICWYLALSMYVCLYVFIYI